MIDDSAKHTHTRTHTHIHNGFREQAIKNNEVAAIRNEIRSQSQHVFTDDPKDIPTRGGRKTYTV